MSNEEVSELSKPGRGLMLRSCAIWMMTVARACSLSSQRIRTSIAAVS